MARLIGFAMRRHAPAAWLTESAKCSQGVTFHPSSSSLSKNGTVSGDIVSSIESASQYASFRENKHDVPIGT